MASDSGTTGDKGTPKPGDAPAEHISTIEILHQHTIGPTRKEKVILPFVLILIGAILAGILFVVWDHKSKDYRVAATVGDVVKLAQQPLSNPSGLKALLNPGDDQYVAFTVKSWQYWAGKGAVTADHYLHAPDLKTESMEALVKGERGAASITFRLDLSKSTPPDYNVVEIVRGGLVIPENVNDLQIFPLAVVAKPEVGSTGADGAYVESHDFDWRRESSFRDAGRFIAQGRLQKADEGFRIEVKNYSVALSPRIEPGLAEILNDITGMRQSERVTFFLDLKERAPAAERQETHIIGLADVDGVDFGKFYVANRP